MTLLHVKTTPQRSFFRALHLHHLSTKYHHTCILLKKKSLIFHISIYMIFLVRFIFCFVFWFSKCHHFLGSTSHFQATLFFLFFFLFFLFSLNILKQKYKIKLGDNFLILKYISTLCNKFIVCLLKLKWISLIIQVEKGNLAVFYVSRCFLSKYCQTCNKMLHNKIENYILCCKCPVSMNHLRIIM